MKPMSTHRRSPGVELADPFWAPRLEQLASTTLPVLLHRLEDHGVVAAFDGDAVRRGLWFSDSDLYKWMEAAARARRLDLLEPIVAVVADAQHPDGYLNSYYDRGPGSPGRYVDLANSHEWYCGGHLIEAALAHHDATGERTLLDVAVRWADHLCSTFGPGGDERIDGHPEVELALVHLSRATGDPRYLAMARWIIERTVDLSSVDLAGHAVRAIYLASAIAEVAISTGDGVYTAAATRLWRTMVDERSYPTGAVGGRWLGESVGRPFELGDDTSYTESCAAVAAMQFAWRMWMLTESTSCLDHMELILYNAVAAGVGSDGETWFYSQPHAYSGDGESLDGRGRRGLTPPHPPADRVPDHRRGMGRRSGRSLPVGRLDRVHRAFHPGRWAYRRPSSVLGRRQGPPGHHRDPASRSSGAARMVGDRPEGERSARLGVPTRRSDCLLRRGRSRCRI